MNLMDGHLSIWLVSSLFWIAAILVPLGLFLVIAPARATRMVELLNRWVSTQVFINVMDKPRYRERFFYRHHRLLGAIIILFSSLSLYTLVFYSGMDTTAGYFQSLARSDFEAWLFADLYYILTGALLISVVTGCIVFVRPSVLKKIETWGNRWVKTEEKLQQLDKVHEIPANVFSERPRVFGVFILLGAAYIMYRTKGVVF